MASVILPTTRWTAGAESVVDGLREDDELLVVCDAADDPAATDAPERAAVVVAGDPEGCAGKANALAAGMERASHDVVVWTDDDVAREPGWLDRLTAHAGELGAATEVPVFVGGGLWSLLEPAFVVMGTSGVYSGIHVWGGGVAFDRTKLDEDALLRDLRRTVGDDSLLSTHVDDPWVDRGHVREVRVDGGPRATYDRVARFAKGAYFFELRSIVALFAVLVGFVVLSVAVPLAGVALGTLAGAVSYAVVGVRRPSVLWSFPSLLVAPFVLLVGLAVPTFRWGGRTYRWRGAFDVEVLD